MFITRKKLEEFIRYEIDQHLHLKKWYEFYDSVKIADFVFYEELEWEVVGRDLSYGGLVLCLKIGNQTKNILLLRDHPENIDFVYE